MNIRYIFQKIKDKTKPIENDIILVITIVCVGLIAFGLGRLSAVSEKKPPVSMETTETSMIEVKPQSLGGMLVASKNGTKYHYPWCSGSQTIKEENKVWFQNKEEAEEAGYSPAGNCKGL